MIVDHLFYLGNYLTNIHMSRTTTISHPLWTIMTRKAYSDDTVPGIVHELLTSIKPVS